MTQDTEHSVDAASPYVPAYDGPPLPDDLVLPDGPLLMPVADPLNSPADGAADGATEVSAPEQAPEAPLPAAAESGAPTGHPSVDLPDLDDLPPLPPLPEGVLLDLPPIPEEPLAVPALDTSIDDVAATVVDADPVPDPVAAPEVVAEALDAGDLHEPIIEEPIAVAADEHDETSAEITAEEEPVPPRLSAAAADITAPPAPPVVAPEVVGPPVAAAPVIAPPVVAPPVVAPEVVAPPVAAAPTLPAPDAFEQGPVGVPVPELPVPEEIAAAAGLRSTEPVQVEVKEGRPALERFLAGLVIHGGSDIHLSHGEVPRYRVSGALLPVGGERALTDEDLEALLSEALHERAWQEFLDNGDVDTAYQMDEAEGSVLTSRFRVNVARSMGHITAVMRVIPTKIVTLQEMGVPNSINSLCALPRGLVLVCGPTGSGKSTLLAGMVNEMNETRTERIWTFEDPVEFTHSSKKCLVNHREIGEDTPSFAEGLRRVRREDPDIILIGEMRDYETIDAAIEAADTGHLVMATLHTNSAPETISRIINSFPGERQDQVRTTLSSVLMAVICQTLVPAPTSPRGRVAAREIMMVTPAIRNNIRENDIPAIANALTDQSTGSISLDAHLAELVRQKVITKTEALKKASGAEALERLLGGRSR